MEYPIYLTFTSNLLYLNSIHLDSVTYWPKIIKITQLQNLIIVGLFFTHCRIDLILLLLYMELEYSSDIIDAYFSASFLSLF